MALLAVQQAKIKGTQVTMTAASGGGDTFALAGPSTRLRVRNAGGSAVTVTTVIPGNVSYGEAAPDIPTSSIPATTGDVVIGPFPPEAVDPDTGLVTVTYSGTTSVTVAVIA